MNGRLPIDDLRLIALCELQLNPSITVYTMVDGRERRRPANAMRRLSASIDEMIKMFTKLGESAQGVGTKFIQAMQAAQR